MTLPALLVVSVESVDLIMILRSSTLDAVAHRRSVGNTVHSTDIKVQYKSQGQCQVIMIFLNFVKCLPSRLPGGSTFQTL